MFKHIFCISDGWASVLGVPRSSSEVLGGPRRSFLGVPRSSSEVLGGPRRLVGAGESIRSSEQQNMPLTMKTVQKLIKSLVSFKTNKK